MSCLSKCVGLSIILKRPLTTTISIIVVGRFTIKFLFKVNLPTTINDIVVVNVIHVKLKKSTVEFHTSKNILKMINQSNQSRQVLFYLLNTL
jgi:hypothetical protein